MSESVQTREREGVAGVEMPNPVVPPAELEVEANERLRLRVTGMSCAGCALSVEKALEKVPGVVGAVVNVASSAAGIRYNATKTQPKDLVAAVESAGYGASLDDEEGESSGPSERLWLLWTAALTLPVLLINHGVAGIANPNPLLLGVTTVLLFTAGLKFYRGAWYALKNRSANMDVLVAMGITAAWAFSAVVTLLPDRFAGAATHFEATAMLILFIRFGKMLEGGAKRRADESLRALVRLRPDHATVVRDGARIDVPLADVARGNRVLVRPGERIPVDGIVVEGSSSVDESPVTGESNPIFKKAGDTVTSGTEALDGSFTLEATAVGGETFVARMVRMVEEAQLDRAPVQRLADRLANVFVPVVVAIASVTLAVWYFAAGQTFAFALERAVTVLVISCPCALGLATPTAILVGTSVGLRRGILFRKGSTLERIAGVRAVMFDKTGTITRGEISLEGMAIDENDELTALTWAAAGAARSIHPLSKAVAEAAMDREVISADPTDFVELRGKGLKYNLQGATFAFGVKSLVEEDRAHPAFDAQAEAWAREGYSVAWLHRDQEPVALFALRDEAREGVPDTIARIERLGIRTALVSGDSQQAAESVAAHVGIGRVYARVSPEGKVAIVEQGQQEFGPVAMVGDGINDAPALAKADVGIAVGAGTDIAKETGDIILVQNNLGDVASAIELGKATLAKIRQNLFWALIYNVVAIPVAAGVFLPWGIGLPPAYAGLAMALSSVAVVMNSVDLKRWQPVGV